MALDITGLGLVRDRDPARPDPSHTKAGEQIATSQAVALDVTAKEQVVDLIAEAKKALRVATQAMLNKIAANSPAAYQSLAYATAKVEEEGRAEFVDILRQVALQRSGEGLETLARAFDGDVIAKAAQTPEQMVRDAMVDISVSRQAIKWLVEVMQRGDE